MARKHYAGYSQFSRVSSGKTRRQSAKSLDWLTSEQFFYILRSNAGKPIDKISRMIESRCLDELTVLCSDSSGFSRRTQEFGVIQFLTVMTECYDRLIPLLEKRNGECLSHNADNLLAVFRRPADAVAAAVDMNRWLEKRNKDLPEARVFNICVGIHAGKLLRLKDNVFGDTVNVASKIGEDTAGKGDILVTASVADGLNGRFKLKPYRTVAIGRKEVKLSRVIY